MSHTHAEITTPDDAHKIVESLLAAHDFDADERAAFLSPSYDAGCHDPWLLPDMEQAVERINTAIEKNERIVIYGDYDCDGIPATVLLYDLLQKIGHTNMTVYIPDRQHEGFGLHQSAIDTLRADNASLIITVDLGSSNVAEVAYAQKQGCDVIVTDHHEVPDPAPDAVAVVNPKRSDSQYPFPGLAGAGVAFKLVCAFLNRYRDTYEVPVGWEKWLLDLVAIATISDMVPLIGENRVFTHYGLVVLRKNRRPGLRQLFRQIGMQPHTITEDDIGFLVVPRINAASRLDSPLLAFHLLAARVPDDATYYAKQLTAINNKRKTLVATTVKEAKKKLKQQDDIPPVIVVGNPQWHIGVLGLVASKLVDEYSRPAFVWGRDGNECIKGSCRSDGATNMVALMERIAQKHLRNYGGHQQAGGFSVEPESIHHLPTYIHKAYEEASQAGALATEQAHVAPTFTLHLSAISHELFDTLAALAPFGMGNPKPKFVIPAVTVSAVSHFGKQKNHLSLELTDAAGNTVTAIAFYKTADAFSVSLQAGVSISLVGELDRSVFRGTTQFRFKIDTITTV